MLPKGVSAFENYARSFAYNAGARNTHFSTGENAPAEYIDTGAREQNPRCVDVGDQPSHDAQQDQGIRTSTKELCMTSTAPLLSTLESYLKLTTSREQSISANMANIDTP